MSWDRRRTFLALAAALLAGVAAGVAFGLADDDGSDPPEPAPAETAATGDTEPGSQAERPKKGKDEELPPPEADPEGAEPGPSGAPPQTSAERAAAGAARTFVRALTLRNGGAVCRSFVPGALHGFPFPEERGTCAASVEASLGFRGPRGAPVWKRSEMTNYVSARIEGESARVVATIYTEYRDVREPTIEDDIIYLELTDDRWLVAKPSATFYRAIGDTDVPPAVLAPPK